MAKRRTRDIAVECKSIKPALISYHSLPHCPRYKIACNHKHLLSLNSYCFGDNPLHPIRPIDNVEVTRSYEGTFIRTPFSGAN
jgi:hypothetical protein